MKLQSPDDQQKSTIRRKRDSAFSAKLDIESDDKVCELLSLDEKLFAITLKAIIRISTPDEIDPQMEAADAPLTQSVIAKTGSRSPIVARTILQTMDALPYIAGPEQQSKIVKIAWEVMLRMLEFESIVASLDRDISETITLIEARMEEYTRGFSPSAPPIVQDLESRFKSAVLTANQALHSISDLFPAAFKDEFARGRYDRIIKWAEKKFGSDDILTLMLRGDHRWINTWGEVRNAIEHPKSGFRLTINNFRLLANRQIQLPTWQLEHPTLDLNRPQELVRPLFLHRDNIIGLFENMLIVLIDKTTTLGFQIGYIDIDEKDRDPQLSQALRFSAYLAAKMISFAGCRHPVAASPALARSKAKAADSMA